MRDEMAMPPNIGPLVIIAGLVLVGIGLLIWTGGLDWFGRLPGDVRIERENARIYLPITSMVLLSLALSAALYLVRRFF
ncbi:MAG: DUF2905 domain-containing protein [Rhodothermales bacterium]